MSLSPFFYFTALIKARVDVVYVSSLPVSNLKLEAPPPPSRRDLLRLFPAATSIPSRGAWQINSLGGFGVFVKEP